MDGVCGTVVRWCCGTALETVLICASLVSWYHWESFAGERRRAGGQDDCIRLSQRAG